MSPKELTHIAFKKLKRAIYYDKNDLFLRRKIAEFECSDEFENNLEKLSEVAFEEEPLDNNHFKKWLSLIDFRLVPKKIASPNYVKKNYISNVTSSETYHVEKVNYFFDGPIELHLISTLWLMFDGFRVDSGLPKCCFGARLHHNLNSEADKSSDLFLKYHELYTCWRDEGIKKAKDLLTNEKKNVYILGLDVQEYFYHIRLDYEDLQIWLDNQPRRLGTEVVFENKESKIGAGLLRCLNAIGNSYHSKVSQSLNSTHPNLINEDIGLPIGLLTSPVLANWYLKDFDQAILENVRPAYYGRYVDDILMVIASGVTGRGSNAIEDFIKRTLLKPKLLIPKGHEDYEIRNPGNLFLKKDKCILQHFDANHSIAGLEKFQKKLEANASDFMLLPAEETNNTLGEVAYDLLYDGSVNKFRSVKGLAENRFELAKHLSRQTMTHLLTDDLPDTTILEELHHFFRGSNAIKFYDLWEKMFTFFVVANNEDDLLRFEKQIILEIRRLKTSDPDTNRRLRKNLTTHLQLSKSISRALAGTITLVSKMGNNRSDCIWRQSNLIRHHLIPFPILNYTNYQGSLVQPENYFSSILDYNKIRSSPRYIHFDECLMFFQMQDYSNNQDIFIKAKSLFLEFNGYSIQDVNINQHGEA